MTDQPACPDCLGRGYTKAWIDASPPYYADDHFEYVECGQCGIPEVVVEEEEPEAQPKRCPRCAELFMLAIGTGSCTTNYTPLCKGSGRWTCSNAWCRLGACEECYALLPN